MDIEQFIRKWQGIKGGAERANYQLFLTEFAQALDLPTALPGEGGVLGDYQFDGPVPGGIEVTMRWDYTELPSGMTAKKLRVAHLLGNGEFVQVKGMCSDGAPMPCFTVAPHKLADRDIQATFLLPSNRVTRGY